MQRGHRAACMFFVVTGQLRILRVKGETSTDDSYEHQADNVEGEVKDKEHSSVTLEEGSWIGDICLFKETVSLICLLLDQPQNRWIVKSNNLFGLLQKGG